MVTELVKKPKSALYVDLKTAILTLDLRPGSDLDEVSLTRKYSLSRTPLREVFRQLSGEGYVELRDNRGARVAEMSHNTLRDFFLAAPMIYGAILQLAALNATEDQVNALDRAQAAFKAALRKGSAADRALANNRFHEITGEMADNVYLLPSFKRLLIDHARIGMTFYQPQTPDMIDNLNEATQQHDAIIAAIRAKDASAAGQLAEDHWNLSRNQIEMFVMPDALDLPLGTLAKRGADVMTPIFRFEGIYTPLVTAFNDDFSIDWDGVSDVIENLIASGVHGIITGGSTGENYAQTVAERIELAQFTFERIKGRVPMIVGTGAMLTADSIALATAAREIGAAAILLASPPYAVPTERENALNALAIDKAANLPVMLYNYPGRTGTMMGDEFLDRVGRSRNFCGIKESSGDINRVHALARDYPHIQLGCGMDDQALEFFAWGSRFWVCGGSNFLPEEHVALYQACAVEGDFTKGRQIMSAMMPLMRVLEQGGKFVQTIKYGATHQGIDTGAVRPPLKGLNKDDKRQLEQVVRVLKRTVADITGKG